MRIAFLGKGGAGKTTTAAGFIKYMAEQYPYILAIDADVNAHLSGALQLEGKPQELGELFGEIIDYLRGTREDLGDRPMIGTTPPSLKSNFIRISKDDPFISKYALTKANISLLTVGTYKESDVGGSCYHTKLKGLAAIFHHMLDEQNDVVIADTTAGTDNVATSLSFVYDLNIFVVEPTRKSLNVYRDFINVAPHLEERTYVLANKVDSKEDEDFIRTSIPSQRFLGFIPFSHHLKRFEQGHKSAINEFQKEQGAVFEVVAQLLKSKQRNWDKYLELLRSTHSKVCRDWFDNYFGMPLDIDLDTAFNYKTVLANKQLSKELVVV